MNDKIWENMNNGLSFKESFFKAKGELGDINLLIKEFDNSKENDNSNYRTKEIVYPSKKMKLKKEVYIALSPFIFLFLGFVFDAWSWGWVIIPLSAIWISNISLKNKIISSSPLIYILLGFFFNMWAFGWVIIPISAIVLNNLTFE